MKETIYIRTMDGNPPEFESKRKMICRTILALLRLLFIPDYTTKTK